MSGSRLTSGHQGSAREGVGIEAHRVSKTGGGRPDPNTPALTVGQGDFSLYRTPTSEVT